MEMLLLAARPREIEKEVKHNDDFQIVKETATRDGLGHCFWEIFMTDAYGIMKIIRSTSSRTGEVDDVAAIYLLVSDMEEAAQAAKELRAAIRKARLSA